MTGPMPARPTGARTMALVTPSYGPDLARCELQIESLRRTGNRTRHYLIIDRPDREAFRHLESDNVRILASEDLVAGRFRRMPFRGKSLWFNWRTLPVRGWILQQILKIAIARHVDEDVLVYCDSDVAFTRPFGLDTLMSEGRIGVLELPLLDFSNGWTRTAGRLLGVDDPQALALGYVGNMIAWDRAHVIGMCERIEAVTGLPWDVALARNVSFSEYMIYGLYIAAIVGYPASGHVPWTRELIRPSWGIDLSTEAGLDAFFGTVPDGAVGVMIHSKDGVAPDRVLARLERCWAAGA